MPFENVSLERKRQRYFLILWISQPQDKPPTLLERWTTDSEVC